MDDLRLRVEPVTSVTLLWHGAVETVVEVEPAVPDIGVCQQETVVEFSLEQQDHLLYNHANAPGCFVRDLAN